MKELRLTETINITSSQFYDEDLLNFIAPVKPQEELRELTKLSHAIESLRAEGLEIELWQFARCLTNGQFADEMRSR